MIRFLLKTIFMMVALSPIFSDSIEAYCSRCVKIEEAREREQKNNPQSIGYYDDQMKLDGQDKTVEIKSTPSSSENSTKTGVGDLSPQPKLNPPSIPPPFARAGSFKGVIANREFSQDMDAENSFITHLTHRECHLD